MIVPEIMNVELLRCVHKRWRERAYSQIDPEYECEDSDGTKTFQNLLFDVAESGGMGKVCNGGG